MATFNSSSRRVAEGGVVGSPDGDRGAIVEKLQRTPRAWSSDGSTIQVQTKVVTYPCAKSVFRRADDTTRPGSTLARGTCQLSLANPFAATRHGNCPSRLAAIATPRRGGNGGERANDARPA